MPFYMDYTPAGPQALAGVAGGYLDTLQGLEARDQELAQREAKLELARQSADLAAKAQEQDAAYRQGILKQNTEAMAQKERMFRAELMQDPNVAAALARAEELGEMGTLEQLGWGSEGWFARINQLAEEAGQERLERRMSQVLSTWGWLEEQRLVPEGTAAQVQASLATGADPDVVVRETQETLRKTGRQFAKQQRLTNDLTKRRQLLDQGAFGLTPQQRQQADELLSQAEFYAQMEDSELADEMLYGRRDEVSGEVEPGLIFKIKLSMSDSEVQEKFAAQEEELQALRSQAANRAMDVTGGIPSFESVGAGAPKPETRQTAAGQALVSMEELPFKIAKGALWKQTERHTKLFEDMLEAVKAQQDPAAVAEAAGFYYDDYLEKHFNRYLKAQRLGAQERVDEKRKADEKKAVEALLGQGWGG